MSVIEPTIPLAKVKRGMIGGAARALLIILFCAASAPKARAQVFVIFPERQQQRKDVRWTLADWMKTKKQISAQNFWLAQHTNKVPVDFTYGLDLKPGRLGNEFDVYALWLGFHARYEQGVGLFKSSENSNLDPRDRSGEIGLQLRVFGGNMQNTNLILRGVYEYNQVYRSDSFGGSYAGYSVGPELQIYFAPWLGVRGEYRHRFDLSRISANTNSATLTGDGYFGVAFIEVGSVRLEAGWTNRLWSYSSPGAIPFKFEDGTYVSRLRIFF